MNTPAHRIAVITPYHREQLSELDRCHRSVAAQQVAADHFMIADGHPREEIDAWDVSHVTLPRDHGDNGNTPRGLGSLLASAEGYDFIAYLDADDWYHDGHLQSLLSLWEQTRSPACAALRTFHDTRGALLNIHEPAEDALSHVDTSCWLIHRSGFDAVGIWLAMPNILAPICDRVFLAALLHRKLAICSTGQRSVAFQTQYRQHYLSANQPVPDNAKDLDVMAPALAYLATADGVTRCVEALGFWPMSYVKFE